MESFTGKVAVVTGAGSGIGRGLAQAFAAEGGLAPRQQKMFDLISGRLDTAGVEPADAAAMIADAVRDHRFWVLPNVAAYVPLLRDEVEELLGSAPRG